MANKVTFKELCEAKGIVSPVLIPCTNSVNNSFVFAEKDKQNSAFCLVSKKSATTVEQVMQLIKEGQILSIEKDGNLVPYLCREGVITEIDLSQC